MIIVPQTLLIFVSLLIFSGVMNFRKSLQEAFSKKERAENLLANLENLKKGGGIDETQYTPMKNEYAKTLNEANVEIGHIKNTVSVELAARQRDLDVYNQELKNLEMRFKVGELTADSYQKTNQRTRQKIEKIEQKIAELKVLVESKSSGEIGGYIDISTKKGRTGTAISLTDFFSFASLQEVTSSKGRLLALIGGILLVISVFLPWACVKTYGFSACGSAIGGWEGALGLLMGAIAIGSTFLATGRIRGIGHVLPGVVGIIIVLSVAGEVSQALSIATSTLGPFGEYVEQMVSASIEAGAYLGAIAGILMIIGGIIELKEE